MAAPRAFGPDLGLSILGLGTQYPPHSLKPQALEALSKRFYPETAAMNKVLSINRYTGIDQRSSIGTPDHPLVNQPTAPSIAEIHALFMSDGVPLAVSAARKALLEAGIVIDPTAVSGAGGITHMVSTTCTDSANPGYDHFVAKALGLSPRVEKVLLHGVGCSGGLAALRTAANLALGHAARGLPARVLVVALEVSTTMVRSELDSIHATQETRIGVALFSDCASAVVLSNGIGETAAIEPAYDLLGWEHRVVPDTEADLGFDADAAGWKVVLSPRVPQLTAEVLRPAYDALLEATSTQLEKQPPAQDPADFDWAMHPGGATILTGAERALGISPEHMRASYDTYINHGNSSSATIFSVLDRLRSKDMDALAPPTVAGGGSNGGPHERVIACAFGPGIAVEMCMLRRRFGGHGTTASAGGIGSGNGGLRAVASGLQTPPETESEASSRDGDGDVDIGDVGDEDQEQDDNNTNLDDNAEQLRNTEDGDNKGGPGSGSGSGAPDGSDGSERERRLKVGDGAEAEGKGEGRGEDASFIDEAMAHVELD